jgi:hypothetical protein
MDWDIGCGTFTYQLVDIKNKQQADKLVSELNNRVKGNSECNSTSYSYTTLDTTKVSDTLTQKEYMGIIAKNK